MNKQGLTLGRVKQEVQALRDESERLRATLRAIGDAVVTVNSAGLVDFLNPRAEHLTGWPLDEALGRPLPQVFELIEENPQKHPIELAALMNPNSAHPSGDREFSLLSRNGVEYAVRASLAPIRDHRERILGAVLVFRDITLERRQAQEISYYATHDALTGLVNRRQFEHRLQQIVEEARRHHSQHALCYLDLDRFKAVNDSGGHVAGDELLRQIGIVLRAHTRREDTLARLGGDEFGLILEHCTLAQANRAINAMRKAITEYRFVWRNQTFSVGVTMGLVPITATSESPAELLKAADAACAMAKDEGRDRVHVYRPEISGLARQYRSVQWASRISTALDEDRLRLHCQAIVPLHDREATPWGYEILVRLEEEGGELVLPGAFMGAAERYRLAPRLDRWVVSRLFAWLAAHPRQAGSARLCAINLSDQSLRDKEFARFIRDEARRFGVATEKICFEIGELSALSQPSQLVEFIESLKPLRFQFALDDFSGRLLSFLYLQNIPVDYLKLDSTFIKDITHAPVVVAVTRAVSDLASLLGKKTIAKSVESTAALALLAQCGVDYAQGYQVGQVRPIAQWRS
jgi:diguanylate cyclase (GGDEF)-like protein/PAS domain S-box-containing protein